MTIVTKVSLGMYEPLVIQYLAQVENRIYNMIWLHQFFSTDFFNLSRCQRTKVSLTNRPLLSMTIVCTVVNVSDRSSLYIINTY